MEVVTRPSQDGDSVETELSQVAAVLRGFYLAPLSLSSVQPLLVLAEHLNPDLRRTPPRWQPFPGARLGELEGR